jgi:hypothetical protein
MLPGSITAAGLDDNCHHASAATLSLCASGEVGSFASNWPVVWHAFVLVGMLKWRSHGHADEAMPHDAPCRRTVGAQR